MFLDVHRALRHSSSALKCVRKEDARDQWTSTATRAHRRRYGGVGSLSNLTLDRTQVRPWFFKRAHPHITTQRYRSTSRFASYQRRYWHGPHAQSRDHSRDCNLLCSWSRAWRRALWPVRCHRGHIACTVIRFLPRSCLSHINQRIAVSTPVCADLSRRYIGVGHALIRQSRARCRCRVHVTDEPPLLPCGRTRLYA